MVLAIGRLTAAMFVLAPALALAQPVPVDPWSPPPEPVEPVPVKAVPVDPWSPPPEPVPVEPMPVAPVPVEPASVEPASPTPLPVEPDAPAAFEPVVARSPYQLPVSLPARPLILPSGALTVDLSFSLGRLDRPNITATTGGVSIYAAHVFDSVELALGASFTAFASQDAPLELELEFPTVRSIEVAIRRDVGDDLVLGAGLSVLWPDSDYQGFSPGVSLVKKVHASDRAAVLLGAGLEHERGVYEHPIGGLFDYDRIGVSTFLAVEAALVERVSLYASTGAEQSFLIDSPIDSVTRYRTYFSRLAVVLAPNDLVDVWLNLGISSTGEFESKTFTVTFDLRRLP